MPTALFWSDSRTRSHSTNAAGPAVCGIDLADVSRALRIMRAGRAAGIDAAEHSADTSGAEQAAVTGELKYQLAEIDAALDRVEDGSFGVCHGCGHMIAAARLKTLPHTRYCGACTRRL